MLKRKIENVLEEWKNTPNKARLSLRGSGNAARLFPVRAFAKANYKHVVYLNFLKNPNSISTFNLYYKKRRKIFT